MWLPARGPTATRAAHHGNMGSVAQLSPFGAPHPINAPGIPMGSYENNTTFKLDIHLWKRLKYIEAPIVFADAEIGKGKTSLAIVAALNAHLLAVEEKRQFKIMYEITRRNVGVAELSSLTRELNANVIDIATYGLNLDDQTFGMTPGEQLDVKLECFNYVEKRDANTLEVVILMAALREFLKKCKENPKYKRTVRGSYFEKCLATLTLDQAKEAIASNEEWLDNDIVETDEVQDSETEPSDTDEGQTDETQSLEDEAPAEEEIDYLEEAILSVADIELNEKEFLKTRNNVLLTMARLRKGEYGRVFNGKHSFTELFDQPALGIDLTGINPVTIGLVQTLLWKFKRSAANSSDPERRKRFVFDWEIHDENRESWLSAPYRREVPRYLKRIRAVNCVMWFNLHRIPGDFDTLPEPARSDALNAVREGTIFFHGQHDRPAAKSVCEYFDYTTKVQRKMRNLQKGEFIFRVGKWPPQKVRIVLSQSQLEQTFSEEASEAKTAVSPTLAALAGRH